MDDEACRIYDELNRDIAAERPGELPTADDIGFHAVNYWGSHLTDMRHEREGAVKYAQSVADADGREQAVARANGFFDQKEQDFERHFNAAVKEIRRENGFSFEDNILDDREPKNQQTVEYRSAEQEAKDRAKDDRDAQHAGEGRARFAERTSQLPEREGGEKQRDGEQKGRQTDDGQRGDLTPTQKHIPSREFIEQNGGFEPVRRQSATMTHDQCAEQLDIANPPAPPQRKIRERELGRTRSRGHDLER